jgi:protein-disulfide isomerase
VLEHFSDFQCPFCSRIEPNLQTVLRQYGDRIRLVWRDYPLPFHVHAMLAAEAAREIYAQRGNDAFWRFHDLLFQNQSALERADLERYAQQVGANLARFRRALDQHTHLAAVREDIAAAEASGVSMGTPATFVNGHVVMGAQPAEAFQRVIDAELAAPARR